MVYLDNYNVTSSLKKCGLDAKYSHVKMYIDYYASYMVQMLSIRSTYQKIAKRLTLLMRNYNNGYIGKTSAGVQMPLPDFIDQYFVKELTPLKIYYQQDIKNFKAWEFIEKFTGTSTDKVLEAFNWLSMKRDIPYYIVNVPDSYNALIKIYDTHLMMELAKIFAMFECTATNGMIIITNGIINLKLTKCLTQGTDINKYIGDPKSKFISLLGPSDAGAFIKLIEQYYETLTVVYQYLKANNAEEIVEQCNKIPDLDAIIGKYYRGKKSVSSAMVCKYVVNIENLYLGHIISNCMERSANVDERRDDLKIPVSKPLNKTLVIDI